MKERSAIDRAYDPCECKHLRFEHIADGTGTCARCHVGSPADKACQGFKRRLTYSALLEVLIDADRSHPVMVGPTTLADVILMLIEGGCSLPPVSDKNVTIFGLNFRKDGALREREFRFNDGVSVILD